jgi:hypothetical protein
MATKTASAKKVSAPKTPADRAAAISKSWKNKDVAAARNQKDKVKTGGVEYRSVSAAFDALGIAASAVIPFRKALKAAGRATMKLDDGTSHVFTIVKKAAE